MGAEKLNPLHLERVEYIEDRDNNIKYSYSIYTVGGVPHVLLTQIEEI